MTCQVKMGKAPSLHHDKFFTLKGFQPMTARLLTFPNMTKKSTDCPNRIREWRKARGMNLAELAARVGTTATQLSRMETGERPVTIEWLQRIARPLRISAGELLHPDDNPMLPTPDEATILSGVREQGEKFARTVAAMAEAQRSYTIEPIDRPRNAA
jgi:transcriptional regulator with XRE-family HTH domain